MPWPQKGATAVSLPLGTSAPVVGVAGQSPQFSTGTATNRNLYMGVVTGSNTMQYDGTNPSPTGLATWGAQTGLIADLSTATAATINSLRLAFQTQKLLERDARGGTRYTEIIRAHFGVISPDARLQRPEFLGGSSQRINITPIAQTSGTNASGTTTPMATLAGVAQCVSHDNHFMQSFTEHGVIIGLASVRAVS